MFLFFINMNIFSQDIKEHIAESLKSVVAVRIVGTEPNTKRQLGIRIGNTDKYEPYYNGLGSAFFIAKDLDLYLVTANHVIKESPDNCILIINDSNNLRKDIPLDSVLLKSSPNWYTHSKSDVSILKIDDVKLSNLINGPVNAFMYHQLKDSIVAPERNSDMLVLGFPGGLGINGNTINTITKSIRSASDIIIYPYENKNSEHFLLDDNGFRGFSGGPIISLPIYDYKYEYQNEEKVYAPYLIMDKSVFGLVSSGKTDVGGGYGGFYFIVPSKYIQETIDMAPGYEGLFVFKYPNGTLWSEVVYKNGLLWEVLSNFRQNGESQDKGNLKNGNGSIIKYNLNGIWISKTTYKNGRQIDAKYNDSDNVKSK